MNIKSQTPSHAAGESPFVVEKLPPRELRKWLDGVLHGYLQPICLGLGIFYSALTVVHVFKLPDFMKVRMSLVALGTAGIILLLYFLLGRRRIPARWSHPLSAGIAGLVWLNSILHLYLSQDPMQSTNLAVLIAGAGFFFLSTRWLTVVVAASLLGWFGVAVTAVNPDGWDHYGVLLVECSLLAYLVHTMQIRTHRRTIITLKQLEKAQEHLSHRTREMEKTQQELEKQIAGRRQTDNLLRQFVQNAPAPIVMLDRDRNYLLYSKRWLSDFHLDERDLAGRENREFLSCLPPQWEAVHARCLQGHIEHGEDEPLIREDGSIDWIRWEAHPWYESEGQIGGTLMFVEMITERKRAEEELRSREERLRLYFNLSLIGNAIISLDNRFVEINDRLLDIFGYTAAELRGMTWTSLFHPDDLAENVDQYERIIRGEIEGYSMDQRFLHKSGEVIYASISMRCVRRSDGRPEYLLCNIEDITDRYRAEQALRDSEERLQDFLDNANDLIQSVSPDGRFLYVNRAWKETLGYTDSEVERLTLRDILHPSCQESCLEIFQRVFQGESVNNLEAVFVSKDGRRIIVQGNVNCRMENQRPVATRSIFRDMTEYKRAEEELKAAKVRAEEANNAKSRFLANMSHELRTPLNSVIGFANILKKNKHNRFQDQELVYLDRICRNGTHLLNLINDILDLSKVEAGKMQLDLQAVHLPDLIQDILSQFESQVRDKPVQLLAEIPAALPPLRTDPSKLRQILINLIGNAVKFTPRGSVRIKVVPGSGEHPVRQIEVIDTGIGIPKDRLDIIFEAFQQADYSTARKFGGTGLGLAICRSMCKILGYYLDVSSEEGKGSTFRIILGETPTAGLAVDARSHTEG
ncbi:MAG TPA: PAS domain S-box protein [bacterium]|nr:PAS domain S-box protein [bacterium]HOL93186.1 PAS domain S-box protein [bacterium]HPP00199.1 PAS domain S-box protein [bacterium]HXK93386.1 PAS domain S-box protein [bacterium]